ncbi:MAG: metallophosphoesterase, partial [Nanoarchaeota archaeon]|nr:metallophosphoesterase [Nanoarchaeota archaeon]
MKFAHFADCHIGGWKEDKLRELNMLAFKETVKVCLERNVDFILLPGDLFNTALPQIDYLKDVTAELKSIKDRNIPVYMVAGSHDFSPSGKTMLDVLEKAGLIINVMKKRGNKLEFTIDKTGAKITGMYGKRGGLEIKEYQELDNTNLEQEEG